MPNSNLPASRRCLHPRPTKKTTKGRAVTKPVLFVPREDGRFDDVATDSVDIGLVQSFVDNNSGTMESFVRQNMSVQSRGWRIPGYRQQINAILEELKIREVAGGGNMQNLARQRRATLIVGITGSLGGATEIMHPDATSAYAGYEVEYVRLSVVHSAGRPGREILVPVRRSKIASRKFSTPNRGVVKGPYLFVAAVDDASGLALRFRAWPIWLGAHLLVVRSNYERIGVDVLTSMDCACFTVFREKQLEVLQSELGGNWEGCLTAYGHIPDILVLPRWGFRIGLVEILGLSGFKKYEDGQRAKLADLKAGHDNGQFIAVAVRVPRKNAMASELYIKEKLEDFSRCIAFSPRKTAAA